MPYQCAPHRLRTLPPARTAAHFWKLTSSRTNRDMGLRTKLVGAVAVDHLRPLKLELRSAFGLRQRGEVEKLTPTWARILPSLPLLPTYLPAGWTYRTSPPRCALVERGRCRSRFSTALL